MLCDPYAIAPYRFHTQIAYPSSFDPARGGWASVEDADNINSEDFTAFRSGFTGVGDVLISIYQLLGAEFVAHLVSTIEVCAVR